MDYILLPRQEWGKVLPVFEERHVPMPGMGIIAAAMDNDKLGGFLCLQPQLHTEPIWISREYRGKVNFMQLHKTIALHMPQGTPYFIFAPNDKVARMAELVGSEEKNYRVWQGVF